MPRRTQEILVKLLGQDEEFTIRFFRDERYPGHIVVDVSQAPPEFTLSMQSLRDITKTLGGDHGSA